MFIFRYYYIMVENRDVTKHVHAQRARKRPPVKRRWTSVLLHQLINSEIQRNFRLFVDSLSELMELDCK